MSKSDSKECRKAVERLEEKNLQLARTLQLLEEARLGLADHYDFAPIGFITLDAKGCVREVNLTAARLIGRERAELCGMPFISHVAQSHIKAFLHHLHRCRVEGAKVISDIALRVPGGETLPVELRSVPVLDPRRGDTVFRTAVTDIAERLEAGKALRESEERYRQLVGLLPDGIFIQCEGKIVFANPAALLLCGPASESDLLGRAIADLVPPGLKRRAIRDMLNPSLTARIDSDVETKLLRRNGESVDVEIAVRPCIHEGKEASFVIVRDITRRKIAEKQAVAISERQQARFGQDLHDGLCQSLAGVACLAEALSNQLREAHSSAVGDSEDIAVIVRQCIDEARMLAKGLYPVHMETNGLVSALYELANEISHRTRVACALECDESISIADLGVATHLYRIAQEAIGNAIKHGSAKKVTIQLLAHKERLTLILRNDGKAFPARPKKTGIGLHAMRYRASMIGGLLDVRRDGARGTVVTCSFPMPKAATQPAQNEVVRRESSQPTSRNSFT